MSCLMCSSPVLACRHAGHLQHQRAVAAGRAGPAGIVPHHAAAAGHRRLQGAERRGAEQRGLPQAHRR